MGGIPALMMRRRHRWEGGSALQDMESSQGVLLDASSSADCWLTAV